MAGTVNKVILIGNVVKDPEIRNTQDSKKVANIVLATSESWKDKISGERKEKTEWHKISVFSEGLVDITEKYIKKGTKLYIEGSIQTKKWTDQQGIEKYSTEIVIQGYNGTITMLGNKNSENYQNDNQDEMRNDSRNNNGSDERYNHKSDDEDDDIPF